MVTCRVRSRHNFEQEWSFDVCSELEDPPLGCPHKSLHEEWTMKEAPKIQRAADVCSKCDKGSCREEDKEHVTKFLRFCGGRLESVSLPPPRYCPYFLQHVVSLDRV
jgi:hypothetical protein